MEGQHIKLRKFRSEEEVDNRPHWKIKDVHFQDFNLLLGDNAQGKTRLFNSLSFLRDTHLGISRPLSSEYHGTFFMEFCDENDIITYELEIRVGTTVSTQTFQELIKRNDKVLFDRSKGYLVEETSGQIIEKFFLPDTSPVTVSIKEGAYPTILSLRSFFERMLFLHANRFVGSEIFIDKTAILLNPKGSNIGDVLANWKEKFPQAYGEVINTFRKSLPFVQDVSVKDHELNNGMTASLMFMTEKRNDTEIEQVNWSDGLLRLLCLITLPSTQFQTNGNFVIRPSFICVDEIENGLDFKTLAKVISHYESYSDLIQIAITTHSPLVCNLVDPKSWLIVKRNGITVQALAPRSVEDLDQVRLQLKTDNWGFYRRHISQSQDYKPSN